MPAGKTHEKINWVFLHTVIFIVLQVGSYISYGLTGLLVSLLIVGGYLFGTYYFGPDLDIKSRPFYRWGVFRFLWKPYQKMFHHRSFWTHSLIISDIVRVAYLLLWLLVPYSALYVVANPLWQEVHAYVVQVLQYGREMLCFLLGVTLASTLHIVADKWSSFFKKRKRKKRSR